MTKSKMKQPIKGRSFDQPRQPDLLAQRLVEMQTTRPVALAALMTLAKIDDHRWTEAKRLARNDPPGFDRLIESLEAPNLPT